MLSAGGSRDYGLRFRIPGLGLIQDLGFWACGVSG